MKFFKTTSALTFDFFNVFDFYQEEDTGEIVFYMKGADVVMQNIVQFNDWLEEEVHTYTNIYNLN